MARATKCRPCTSDFNCFIIGQQIYKDIQTPILQEEYCKKESSKRQDEHIMKVVKEVKTVEHRPPLFSKRCSFTLLSGKSMKEKQEKQRGNRL